MDTERVCMFTGHRKISVSVMGELSDRLDALIEKLISEGYHSFCAGGALGFDTLAALKVIEKKKKYGFIKLYLYLPCRGQELSWSDGMKKVYYYAVKNADQVKYSCETYVTGCMQKRNREMVAASQLCVAYCDINSGGGSDYTVKYAQKSKIPVINLYP